MSFKSPIPPNELKFNVPVPYDICVDRELLDLTTQKLKLARYPEEQSDFGENNWTQGAKVSRVRQLAEHWQHKFNWDAQEKILNNAFNHFIVKLDVPGYGALPSFHVVAPSIPGFGFSPAPTKSGVGPNVVARAYKILMTEVLGYPKFVTQGGDFGSFITRSIAIQYPDSVRAQHLNMFPVPPPTLSSGPVAYIRWCLSAFTYTDFEHKALQIRRNFEKDQSGYLEQQRTRPQTLGFALGDSPIGLLAWFVEKIHDWAEVYDAFSDDDIITLVMMHWIQGATPALRFYREAFGDRQEAERTFETYVSAPTGVSMYAKEQLHCPRDWADRAANIQFWREYEKGGHFSSLERPDLFVKDVREFFSSDAVLHSWSRD
ncbi:unnamed protein product [Penicillium salamii]|nr:unnamed protein product [Penicillium salamii]CAG8270238.1 unnamed protein product [Penicillium salamii]